MATPRKRWFKVADSVAYEPWSNDVLATLIRLSAYLNQRWTRDGVRGQAVSMDVPIPMRVLQGITGCEDARTALRRCHQAARKVTLTVRVETTMRGAGGKLCILSWPKWADFQGLLTRELPESPPRVARESPPPKTKTKTKTKRNNTKKNDPLPNLGDAFFAKLGRADSNPWGRPIDPTLVRQWFRWAWGVKGLAGRYTGRGLKRGVRVWWSRAKDYNPGCLKEAREWCERIDAANLPRDPAPPRMTDEEIANELARIQALGPVDISILRPE